MILHILTTVTSEGNSRPANWASASENTSSTGCPTRHLFRGTAVLELQAGKRVIKVGILQGISTLCNDLSFSRLFKDSSRNSSTLKASKKTQSQKPLHNTLQGSYEWRTRNRKQRVLYRSLWEYRREGGYSHLGVTCCGLSWPLSGVVKDIQPAHHQTHPEMLLSSERNMKYLVLIPCSSHTHTVTSGRGSLYKVGRSLYSN